MPLYSSQTGMPTPVYPGQQFTLFSGTETPGASVTSTAFERAANWSGNPSPQVFAINFATAPTAVVQIQASNDNVDAHYMTISTVTFPLNPVVNNSWVADYGEFRYYRAVLSTYSAGGMPVVTIQR
jgi:hypothetical protein